MEMVKNNTIYLGSDHAGFQLKEEIKNFLSAKSNMPKFAVVDKGINSDKKPVNFPDYAKKVCLEVIKNKDSLGILVCGTGIGMSIAANKMRGIRAALAYDEFTAKMSKEHNNANVICFGSRSMNHKKVLNILQVWLNSSFTKEERHIRRINKITEMEKQK